MKSKTDVPAMSRKPYVLFMCTHNAARSQIAEALLRKYAGHRFEVARAGFEPTEVHPLTRQVLSDVGIDPSGLVAKGLRDFLGKVAVRHAPAGLPFYRTDPLLGVRGPDQAAGLSRTATREIPSRPRRDRRPHPGVASRTPNRDRHAVARASERMNRHEDQF